MALTSYCSKASNAEIFSARKPMEATTAEQQITESTRPPTTMTTTANRSKVLAMITTSNKQQRLIRKNKNKRTINHIKTGHIETHNQQIQWQQKSHTESTTKTNEG